MPQVLSFHLPLAIISCSLRSHQCRLRNEFSRADPPPSLSCFSKSSSTELVTSLSLSTLSLGFSLSQSSISSNFGNPCFKPVISKFEEIGPSDVSTLPATVLYDFANAFPSLSHKWLFKVLRVVGIPNLFIQCIQHLYSCISAYSSGVGTESFLFKVERGVKTGCPLSSILFLLAINPFIHLFQWLSDNPGASETRICADDFGSALRNLSALRVQHSIFRLTGPLAGLFLKPQKCQN